LLGDDEFAAWFRLLETPGIGRDAARRLLAACGSPAAVFTTPAATLRALVGTTAATALQQEPAAFAPRLAAARQWLQGGPDRTVLTLGDAAYPPRLLQTADPPLLLYVQGRADALAQPSVAIVGSRHPTAQGIDNARAFGQALGAQGYVVVSGLALGIDGAAHEGALDAPAGTVCVPIERWRAAHRSRYGQAADADSAAAERMGWKRALQQLQAAGIVVVAGEWVHAVDRKPHD